MPWLLLFSFGCGLVCTVAHANLGGLTVSRLNGRTVSSYECQTDVDILIHYRSVDAETITIAQCKPAINACYLLDQAFGEYYGVSLTGHIVMFNVIREIEKTSGTYILCETQNSTACISVEIEYPDRSTTENMPHMHIPFVSNHLVPVSEAGNTCRQDNATADSDTVIIVLLVVQIAVTVICSSKDRLAKVFSTIVVIVKNKKWNDKCAVQHKEYAQVEVVEVEDTKSSATSEIRTTASDCRPNATKLIKVDVEEGEYMSPRAQSSTTLMREMLFKRAKMEVEKDLSFDLDKH